MSLMLIKLLNQQGGLTVCTEWKGILIHLIYYKSINCNLKKYILFILYSQPDYCTIQTIHFMYLK